MRASLSKILGANGLPLRDSMATFSGADTLGRELREWDVSPKSADVALLDEKETLDTRTKDIGRNHGIAAGALQTHVDSIVGHRFKLSYKPNYKALGITKEQADKVVEQAEAKFNAFAEDPEGLIDAEGKRTLTMLIRQAIYTHTNVGEILATAEWKSRVGYKTCLKLINTDRLCNPQGKQDSKLLRGGVEIDALGEAQAYWIRTAHESEECWEGNRSYTWKRVPKKTRWGRLQALHIFEPLEADQNRGSTPFASVLSKLRMLDGLQRVTLQNAIINAQYAAVIESDLGPDAAYEALGNTKILENYLQAKADYLSGTNIKFDGAKIAHLFPGEKLKLETARSPIGLDNFEQMILRYIAAGLNMSYEQLSRDYSKTNYSSARASMLESWRFFLGKREVLAKRLARIIFALWLEEAINKGDVVLPNGAPDFYEAKGAWTDCDWIAAGRPQIDGLKEVKESILRIEAGLSTYEKECAQMGEDYQDIFAQQVREMKERKAAGLPMASWELAEKLAPNEAPETNTNSQTA